MEKTHWSPLPDNLSIGDILEFLPAYVRSDVSNNIYLLLCTKDFFLPKEIWEKILRNMHKGTFTCTYDWLISYISSSMQIKLNPFPMFDSTNGSLFYLRYGTRLGLMSKPLDYQLCDLKTL